MAGLIPAIQALLRWGCRKEGVDARDRRGHDDGDNGSIAPELF
jgi:hypothetical protein